MAVRISRSLLSGIKKMPGSILVQVQGASNPEAAAAALSHAAREVAALDGGWESAPGLSPGDTNGPKFVGQVVTTPSGPMVYIDGGYTPEAMLTTIPDIVRRHLTAAGVVDALIAPASSQKPLTPEQDPNQRGLLGLPRMVVLHLYPPPEKSPRSDLPRSCAKVPQHWLERAAAWLTDPYPADQLLWASSMMYFQVPPGTALQVIGQFRKSGSGMLLAGDVGSRIRAVHCQFIGFQGLSMAVGGPEATDDALLEGMEELAAFARPLAPEVAYAYVSVEETLTGIWRNRFTPWYRAGGASPTAVDHVCDEIVLDAFPWQILSPGHLRRLAAGGVEPARAKSVSVRALAGSRVELAVNEPALWLLDHPDGERARAVVHSVLRPCLISDDDSWLLMQAKEREETMT